MRSVACCHDPSSVPAPPGTRFFEKLCAVGRTELSTRKGEDVIPAWFKKHSGPAPFISYVDGKPAATHDGSPRQLSSLPGANVPMCRSCNSVLNRRFEQPSKDIIRELVRSGRPPGESGTRLVTLWLLKTALLLQHPDIAWDDPAATTTATRPRALPVELLDWMATGAVPPTEHLSLFVHVEDDNLPDRDIERLVVFSGCMVQFGLDAALQASVVHHPHQPVIDHPGVVRDEAVRLWPPDEGIELRPADIAPTPPGVFRWTLYGSA